MSCNSLPNGGSTGSTVRREDGYKGTHCGRGGRHETLLVFALVRVADMLDIADCRVQITRARRVGINAITIPGYTNVLLPGDVVALVGTASAWP